MLQVVQNRFLNIVNIICRLILILNMCFVYFSSLSIEKSLKQDQFKSNTTVLS